MNIGLKWPNDVLIDGRKAAGILLETESTNKGKVDWVVIGIGVNIVHAPEGFASLKSAGIENLTAKDLMLQLSRAIIQNYRQLELNGFGEFRRRWLEYAVNIGKIIKARLPQETVEGVFTGIDDTGALLLDMPDGSQRTVASGEVFL